MELATRYVDLIDSSWGLFLAGVWITVQLLALSTLFGVLLAIPIALARMSRSPMVNWPASAYAFFFRGTPLLVQLFLIYYGLAQFEFIRGSPVWPLLREPFTCALLAFSLNMAGYVSEVIRGGMLGVPRGEIEAARAMGMGTRLLYRRIILPRGLRLALPALGNEVVLQLKATALASTVTLIDLTGVGRRLVAKTYSMEALFVAGALYIALTYAIARGFRLLERRFNRYQTV